MLLLKRRSPPAKRKKTWTLIKIFPLIHSNGPVDRGDLVFRCHSTLARMEYIRSHGEERPDHVSVSSGVHGLLWPVFVLFFFVWIYWNYFFSSFLRGAGSECSVRTTTTTRPVRRSAGPGTTSLATIPAATRVTRCAYRAGRAPTVRKVSIRSIS